MQRFDVSAQGHRNECSPICRLPCGVRYLLILIDLCHNSCPVPFSGKAMAVAGRPHPPRRRGSCTERAHENYPRS